MSAEEDIKQYITETLDHYYPEWSDHMIKWFHDKIGNKNPIAEGKSANHCPKCHSDNIRGMMNGKETVVWCQNCNHTIFRDPPDPKEFEPYGIWNTETEMLDIHSPDGSIKHYHWDDFKWIHISTTETEDRG